MISISFTEPDELYIWGSIEDLNDVKRELDELSGNSKAELVINAELVNPTPYDRSLELITVRVTEGPVKIGIDNNFVLITGSKQAISTLSSFFEFEKTARKGDHSHHEYFPENEYIHPDSISTVIGVG